MRAKKVMALVLASVMAVSVLGGCGSSGTKAEGTAANNAANSDGTVDLEIWNVNTGFKPVEKGGKLYQFYKDKIGVGIIQPYVEWNGGTTYQQQLNLKISAGEMPDMFLPVNGMEAGLIKSGALLDLTDILPEKAPHLWKSVPEEVWNIMRSYDPTGEGRIYTIPNVMDYTLMSGLIHQDWLDQLKLSMPKTQEDFENVLKVFKTQDPNGNGVQDEIPTGGRQDAKWMDQLFAMYGLAMWEGNPDWDIYDGKLTYAGVTQNMKDALAYIHDLYKKGYIDPETLLNDKAGWEGKINSNRVGLAYHWSESAYQYAESIEVATGVKTDWSVLPAISAPGYDAFYTKKQVKGIGYVVKNTDDLERIDACMKVLDAYGNEDMWIDFYNGVEGMHSEAKNGIVERKADDKASMENLILMPYNDLANLDYRIQMFEAINTDNRKWAISQAIRNMKDVQQYGKIIAGDGMPASVYDNFPDILNKTLYVEYASKIITGEYDIDKFDEYVEKWYASGGEAVTKAAREWYAKTQQ